MERINWQGIPTVIVEAGQRAAEKSIRLAEKTLFSVLSELGLINSVNDSVSKSTDPALPARG